MYSQANIVLEEWQGIKLYHEFHETCHSVTLYFMKKDSKRCRDTTTLESIHTKDESKHEENKPNSV